MAEEWAINGHRVVRRASLFGGRLVVLDAADAEVNRLPLEGGNTWELPIGTRTWSVARRNVKDAIGRSVHRIDILSAREEPVFPGVTVLLQPIEAPAGSQCVDHGAPAVRSCARCGKFLCEVCLAADAVRCDKCFAPNIEAHAKEQSAAFWAGPVVLFFYGGALSIVLGALAAVAATTYARKVPRERFTAWIPAGFYLTAIALWLVAAKMLRS